MIPKYNNSSEKNYLVTKNIHEYALKQRYTAYIYIYICICIYTCGGGGGGGEGKIIFLVAEKVKQPITRKKKSETKKKEPEHI